jgi:DNA-binding response OmpR family regulator
VQTRTNGRPGAKERATQAAVAKWLGVGGATNVCAVHILVATDADWIVDEIRAALEEPGTTFTLCRDGREVSAAVKARVPDIAILDLQVGSKGGMAITMDLRLDESSGNAPYVRALMLLDRKADVHLAKRSAADGWLIKPLNALRLRRAVTAIVAGGTFMEGFPVPEIVETDAEAPAESVESPEGEPVTTG